MPVTHNSSLTAIFHQSSSQVGYIAEYITHLLQSTENLPMFVKKTKFVIQNFAPTPQQMHLHSGIPWVPHWSPAIARLPLSPGFVCHFFSCLCYLNTYIYFSCPPAHPPLPPDWKLCSQKVNTQSRFYELNHSPRPKDDSNCSASSLSLSSACSSDHQMKLPSSCPHGQ